MALEAGCASTRVGPCGGAQCARGTIVVLAGDRAIVAGSYVAYGSAHDQIPRTIEFDGAFLTFSAAASARFVDAIGFG